MSSANLFEHRSQSCSAIIPSSTSTSFWSRDVPWLASSCSSSAWRAKCLVRLQTSLSLRRTKLRHLSTVAVSVHTKEGEGQVHLLLLYLSTPLGLTRLSQTVIVSVETCISLWSLSWSVASLSLRVTHQYASALHTTCLLLERWKSFTHGWTDVHILSLSSVGHILAMLPSNANPNSTSKTAFWKHTKIITFKFRHFNY